MLRHFSQLFFIKKLKYIDNYFQYGIIYKVNENNYQ